MYAVGLNKYLVSRL